MLEEKIFNDYKEAMKAHDTSKTSVLSCLRADILNTCVSKKKNSLDDSECLAVIKKQIKQHQDSIEQFKNGSRADLAEKETKELEMLQVYLPPQLSELEVKAIITEVITSTGASGMKDMGKVMKEVTAKAGQSADSKLISGIVRAKLLAA